MKENQDFEKPNSWLELIYVYFNDELKDYLRKESNARLNAEEIDGIINYAVLSLAQNLMKGSFEFQDLKGLENYLKMICRRAFFRLYKENRRQSEARKDFEEDLKKEAEMNSINDFEQKEERMFLQLIDVRKRETILLLNECIGALPEVDKDIIEYRYREHLKVREIADQFQRNISWVKGRLFWIRKKLKRCIQKKGGGQLYFDLN